jgi:hypothetical protein
LNLAADYIDEARRNETVLRAANGRRGGVKKPLWSAKIPNQAWRRAPRRTAAAEFLANPIV